MLLKCQTLSLGWWLPPGGWVVLADEGVSGWVAGRARPGGRRRVADGYGAHGAPAVGEVQRRRGDVLAEQGRGDPRRAQVLDGEGDEQVLHGGAHRDGEHGLLGAGPALVGAGVRRPRLQARRPDQRAD